MLDNIVPADQLRGLASRKAKDDEFKSVRHALVDEEIGKGWIVHKRSKTTTRLRKAKGHDKRFEDRVWTLLYRMGFQHLSAQGGAFLLVNPNEPKGPDNQIDIVATDDEVAFAIECKSSESPRRFADFSKDLAKHVNLRERFTRAVREQFPSPNKRPSIFAIWCRTIGPSENDKKRADAEHVSLLDEQDLEYYEQLVNQVGTAARFQFLADLLCGRAVPGLELTVPAIRSKVGGGIAYSFFRFSGISPQNRLRFTSG